jgi:hypothetical protein
MKTPRSIRIAVGLLLAMLGGFVAIGACVSQPFVRASASTPPRVDERRLRTHVEALSAMKRGPDNLAPAVAYIEQSVPRTVRHPFLVDGQTYNNLIVSFGPPDAERIVVGAHYDACMALPGADDNASGVAGAIELARLLADAKLDRRIDVVFWALEEPPHYATDNMGSVAHAKSVKNVRYAISLEMIGYFSDEPGSQHFPAPGMSMFYPTRGSFIAVVGRPADRALTAKIKGAMLGATDLPVYSLNAPAAVQGVDWSDHRSYWAQNIPAVMVTDTSFLRNDRYHTPRDTADTLDYARMAKVVEGVYAAVTQ